jgi:riboflavin kinase/FMN adenylyltransferase
MGFGHTHQGFYAAYGSLTMQVFRHFYNPTAQPLALAIGNFDGVHLGHQALFKRLIATAQSRHLQSAVMTFDPHPREFFTPQHAPTRLTSLREKLELFAAAGIAQVYVCHFNQRFAKLTAEDFLQDVLHNALNVDSVLVGEDFCFGAGRKGSVADIKTAGFNLESLQQVTQQGQRVSSTLVRQALAAGELDQAANLLGRAYSISGKVVHGAKRGRQLGFPTANVHMRHERPALSGVYAVKLDGMQGVANLGLRPTFAGLEKLSLEVHLLDFSGDLYGCHVHVSFLKKLRDEMKFPNLEALKQQIAADCIAARQYFKKL